jgi:ATP adenylyltransferase
MGWVGKKSKGCLFCRIVKDDPKTPKKVLHGSKDVMVVMNIFPYNTGHLQVFPVRHVKDFEKLSEKEITSLFAMVQKCVKLLNKTLKPLGFNIGLNIGGEVSGASVDHIHVHIVPRFRNDFGFIEIIGETKVLPETLDQTFNKLKKEVKMLE